jgi:hypothetical protein
MATGCTGAVVPAVTQYKSINCLDEITGRAENFTHLVSEISYTLKSNKTISIKNLKVN